MLQSTLQTNEKQISEQLRDINDKNAEISRLKKVVKDLRDTDEVREQEHA